MLSRMKRWARTFRRDSHAVYLASRDPRVPWYAKLLAIGVAAYALSPIDLIPDFIPIIGYLDDLIIVPLGIVLAIRMVPPGVMIELRQEAARRTDRPTSRIGLAFMLAIWLLCIILLVRVFWTAGAR